MSRRTKIIIGITAALLVIALAVLVYFFLFREKPPEEPDLGAFPEPTEELPSEAEEPVALPDAPEGPFEPILRQLSQEPVAGAVIGAKSGEPVVRYMERATGNVFEIRTEGGDAKRLTNTTVAKVYEALWSKSGAALIARFVREGSETIESFSAKILPGASGGEGELQGSFLPRGIIEAAIAPDGNSLFYLQAENGGAAGIRTNLSGDAKQKVWSSPLREWLVSWPSQGRILLLSKPSALASGVLYSLDPAGRERLLLRGIPGLTVLGSPAREDILYSESTGSGIALYLLEAAAAKRTDLSVTTLPEKCAFAKSGERIYCGVPKSAGGGSYPDAWYQGVISFSDEIWSVGTDGTTERILDLEEKRGLPIDVTEPKISADEKFLVFTDKESGTLWSLQMTE